MNLRKRRLRRLLLLLLAVLLLSAALLVRYRYVPMLSELAAEQVRNVTTNLITDAVDDELAQGKLRYENLITLEKAPDGHVTALTTNVYEMNCLKSEIVKLVGKRIEDVASEELSVPIGSVIFPLLLSGKGPLVPVRYVAVRSSDAEFKNEFSEAGINQTLHQIILQVDISVTVLLPTQTLDVTVGTDLAVAQTVIVGAVPQTVISMTGEENGSKR